MVDQKRFNWRSLFERHPIFSSLKEKEIERLLREDTSSERDFTQGHVILTEGEVARSCFLIGSGSVRVILRGPNGRETTLSVLRRGEIFGEMALIEKRSRTKTVLAMENCILLEIAGERFLNLLERHPDIESKVLLMLSERLRHTSDQLLEMQRKGVDERFHLFNAKLDADLKAFDALLKAAHAVLDQTRLKTEESLKAVHASLDQAESRTKEVRESAEQSRARLIKYGSAVGGVIVTVISLFGFLGVSKYLDFTDRYLEVRDHASKVREYAAEVEGNASRVKDHLLSVQQASEVVDDAKAKAEDAAEKADETIATLNRRVQNIRKFIARQRKTYFGYVLMPGFREHVKKKSQADAIHYYDELREIDPQAVDILTLLNSIEDAMTTEREMATASSAGPGDFTALLSRILETIPKHRDEETIKCLYLILVNSILVDKVDQRFVSGESYEEIKSRFESRVAELEGKKIIEKTALRNLEKYFSKLKDPKKKELFETIKELIPVES